MSPASPRVSSASAACRSASCASFAPASVEPSTSRCLAISFVSRPRNCRTSSFSLASRLSLSPDSSSVSSSRSVSSALLWLVPALSNCPFSSSCTIVSRRSPTSASRACSKTLRNSAARRGSLGASRSASRRNVFSRSRNCCASSCSRVARPPAAAAAFAAGSAAAASAPPHAVIASRRHIATLNRPFPTTRAGSPNTEVSIWAPRRTRRTIIPNAFAEPPSERSVFGEPARRGTKPGTQGTLKTRPQDGPMRLVSTCAYKP